MNPSLDRLYELLPVVYRLRDYDHDEPLRALLQVIAEQVKIVEEDIAQLYKNWFVETCQDWVVPYIGDLIGYQPVHEAGEPGEAITPQGRARNKILIPRREVANTVRYRRRKGALALLELLANDVAGWPTRAVEFYRLLGLTQSLNHLRLERGRTTDLRNGVALDRLGGPFDTLAHAVDVRRINSRHGPRGRYNIPSLGLFVWRLQVYPATKVEAFHVDRREGRWTFGVLGNNTLLYVKCVPETEPTQIAGELNLPVPIRRHAFERRPRDYYGPNKSLCIWTEDPALPDSQPIPLTRIVAADLSGWIYRPIKDQVAVDPELGRFAFARRSPRHIMPEKVWVTYHHGFSADMGGGEYRRPLRPPAADEQLYRVAQSQEPSPPAQFSTIAGALKQWRQDADQGEATRAIIEIADSGDYVEQPEILLHAGERLELRAAQGKQPVIRLLNIERSAMDVLRIIGPENEGDKPGPRVTLDGLLVAGRGIEVEGHVAWVTLRHCTLVPGWDIEPDYEPLEGTEPSIVLSNTTARLVIEQSITGSVEVNQDAVKTDPLAVEISDSILDATGADIEALSDPDYDIAHAVLTVARSTVIGYVKTHAIELAENTIFASHVRVARRQIGCVRFCYVPPGSRTPRRYQCQPDLVEQPIKNQAGWNGLTDAEKTRALEPERLRVQPQFNSTRYGTPTYCQLAQACADEIKRGADDESEMGVFHDLYQPQRAANLRARLAEYSPAGTDAGIIYAS